MIRSLVTWLSCGWSKAQRILTLHIFLTYLNQQLAASASGINIKSSGLYTASGSVTITPTAAGAVTVYLALNGVTLPCSVRQQTVAAAAPITINTSAIAFGAGACACNTSTLTLVVSGAAGTVDYVTAGAVRLA